MSYAVSPFQGPLPHSAVHNFTQTTPSVIATGCTPSACANKLARRLVCVPALPASQDHWNCTREDRSSLRPPETPLIRDSSKLADSVDLFCAACKTRYGAFPSTNRTNRTAPARPADTAIAVHLSGHPCSRSKTSLIFLISTPPGPATYCLLARRSRPGHGDAPISKIVALAYLVNGNMPTDSASSYRDVRRCCPLIVLIPINAC